MPYTTQQVAEATGLTERAIRAQCERGELRGAYKVGRQWRIPADALPKQVREQLATKTK